MDEKQEFKQACRIVPDGVQTLSKMPSKHVEGVYPYFIQRGEGAYIFDSDGKQYIDYPLGLGPIILGHAYRAVCDAVAQQIKGGNLFSLSHKRESRLAEKIVDYIPCAEMVRFLKTGSEATSAAVKIARAYTNRDKIVCCGYHGWHDWYSITTSKNAGIPAEYKKYSVQLPYNDYAAFEKEFAESGDKIAAVIMEPYIYDAPKDSFVEKVVSLARRNNSVVIFDEVVTGLRSMHGSAQAQLNIKPDLACFGKAIGNGIPIAFVCGRRELMKVLEKDCFVSSTFGGDLLGLVAAETTIDYCRKQNVAEHIWSMGALLKKGFTSIAKELGLNIEIVGYPCRTFFNFPTEAHKSLFWQECLRKGVFFGYAQFISYSHTPQIIGRTVDVARDALVVCKQYWDKPQEGLLGPPAQQTLRHVVSKEINNGEMLATVPKRGRPRTRSQMAQRKT